MRDNPFTPGFGTLPAALVGREEVLRGLDPLFGSFTSTDRHWATSLQGHRGTGKTVLLDQIQDAATAAGWWVIQEDAGAGPPLTTRLIHRGLGRLAEHRPPRRGRRVTSVNLFGAGLGLEVTQPGPATVTSLRDVLEAVVTQERNGVLITIDEIHQASDQTLGELGNAARHLHRNRLPLALVVAGLPSPQRRREPTFLARAWQPALGRLREVDVERCLTETVATAGGAFDPVALRLAVDLTAGEPYLLQLVGYHAWEAARRSRVRAADVEEAALPARLTYTQAVTAPMVGDVSPDQRAFLASMARLGTPTRLGDIRAEHGWSQSQVGVYRQRLLDAGIIAPAGHGLVEFAIPGVADVVADEMG